MKFILPKTLPAFCGLAYLLAAPLASLAEDASPSPAASASASKEFDPADIADLRPLVGQPVTIVGTPVSVGEAKSGKARFLHFGKDWNNSVSLVFFVRESEPTTDALQAFVGKKVRVTGKLELYQNQIEIKLDTLTSIEIVP